MYKISKENAICCILWSPNSELESFFDIAVLHWICYVTVMQQFATLYECYKDLYSADSSGNKNLLKKAVIYLFESNGFQLSNLTDYLELDQQTVLKKVKQNLCKIYEEYFFEAIKDSNRPSPINNKIKSAYKEEEYLSETTYHKYRSVITKFRTSAHCFPIEYGRWIKIEHDM